MRTVTGTDIHCLGNYVAVLCWNCTVQKLLLKLLVNPRNNNLIDAGIATA